MLSTIPTGILCLILDKVSDKIIEGLANLFKMPEINVEMFLIAIALIVMGIILYVVDKKSKSTIKYEKIMKGGK